MRLVILGSRYIIIGKNNGRGDFWRNMERQRNRLWYEQNYKQIYLYSMRNNEKRIENRMIKWRDENDGIEVDERIV